MCLCRNRHLRSLFCQVLAGFLAITSGASSQAQQFPGHGTPNYNWGVPYGLNYNYSFMRYGQAGSPNYPMMQPQPNQGINTAAYGVNGQMARGISPAANPFNQEAVAQAMQAQRQMQVMEPRYDVRKTGSRTASSKARQANKLLTLNQVLSSEGKVLWPGKVPSEGELGKSRAATEAAIEAAFKEFKSDGKASVQKVVEAKEQLYSYGHPALDKTARQSRQSAQKLLHFLTSLEQVLDSLSGA
jgi:hypothetical protein